MAMMTRAICVSVKYTAVQTDAICCCCYRRCLICWVFAFIRVRIVVRNENQQRIERLRANLQSAATTDTSGVLGKGAAASASRTHVRFDANGNADGGRGEKRPRQGDDDASTRTAGAGKSGANSEEEGEENGVRKKKIPRALHKVAVELSLRNKRLGHMKSLEQRLLLQQHQTQKGRRKKISFVREKENGKTEKVVQHVWKRERLK